LIPFNHDEVSVPKAVSLSRMDIVLNPSTSLSRVYTERERSGNRGAQGKLLTSNCVGEVCTLYLGENQVYTLYGVDNNPYINPSFLS